MALNDAENVANLNGILEKLRTCYKSRSTFLQSYELINLVTT